MEITLKTSKKRKQSSSETARLNDYLLSGVLTRQKSQKYFFNHNRSGKSRICTSFPQLPPKKTPEIDGSFIASDVGDGDGDGDGDGCCDSIKDLRARRVFSKPPKKGKLGKTGKGKFDEIGDNSADLIDVNPNLFDVNQVVNSIVEELNCENPNLFSDSGKCDSVIDIGNPNLTVFKKLIESGNPNFPVLKKCDLSVSEKNDDCRISSRAESFIDGGLNQLVSPEKCVLVGGNGEKLSDITNPNLDLSNLVEGRVVDKCEVDDEERVQTTPPEAVIIIRESDEDSALKSTSHVSRSVTKQISPSKAECGDVKRFSISQKEMTLTKCLRRRVFKVPNSFTYKRLLPYLMDMAKDEPCELTVNPSVQTEMDIEVKPSVSLPEDCPIDGSKSSEKLLATMAVCVPLVMAITASSQMDSVSNENKIPDDKNHNVTQHELISLKNLEVTLDSQKTSPVLSKKDVFLDPPCHYSVNSEEECKATDLELKVEESTINKSNSSNPIWTMYKKLTDSGNPNFPVLKKCDSGFNASNPNLPVLEQNGDSMVNLVAEGLSDGDLNQVISPEKHVSHGGNGEKFSDAMSPNLGNDFIEGRVVENCEVEDEETVQTTPPEAVLVFRKSDEENELNSTSYVLRSVTKEMSPSKDGFSDVKNFSDSRKQMTLSKCSRRKVFKVPNSFTYKRLLPYLIDMAKDEPCELTANPTVQTEMDVDEKLVVSSSEKPLATAAVCVQKNVSFDRKYELSEDRNTISSSSQTVSFPSESEMPDDLKQDVPQYEQISPENIAVTLDTSTMSPEVSTKDISVEPPCHLSVDSEGGCIAADIKFQAEESTTNKSNSSNKLAIVVSSGAPVCVPTKGILKRNPLGCRGICGCLNCSSFRLNAEKSFEFSRNQMLEADELAQNLMTEISNLSCMLKKSVEGVTEAENIRVTQVEDACRRASIVEDMAKTRLHQMHEDLYVHCRTKALHRPRVNFSWNVQENGTAGELTKLNDTPISP